jgi:hypothetical protein
MSIFKALPVSARSILFGILFALLLLPGHNPAQGLRRESPFPAYVQRGDEVEKLYRDYTARLTDYRARLAQALRYSAPELLVHLQTFHSTASGYQVLPQIITDPPPADDAQLSTMAYSWPWTRHLIDRELRAVDGSQMELRGIEKMAPEQRRAVLERLVGDYREQSGRHGNIGAHVRYNRFWQAAIAADQAGYDRETALHMLVLERQRIDDRLRRVRASFEKISLSFRRAGEAVRISEITRDLKSRETLLARRIDQAMSAVQSPAFIQMEHAASQWIFRVPLFTDIEDRQFVEEVKRIVESTWRLVTSTSTYRVELDLFYVSADHLYAAAAGAPPARGDKIDMARHLARFPAGGAILTTGGATIHVRDYAIILGPHPVSPRVLAHEFGHVLGFRDRYVRGYKNLGNDGFQVLEVVADPLDIMGASANGMVLSHHFSRLTEYYRRQIPRADPLPQPVRQTLPATGSLLPS